MSWLGPPHDPDRYKVLETTSAGAEGNVLRGELVLDGNPIPVAIKVLHENQEDLEEWERRWNRQTEILRTVQHPSLVTVREAFVGASAHPEQTASGSAENLYLVMNWASGPTLDEWAKGRSTAEVLEVLGSLADAIDYLHSGRGSAGIGVIHRDIKPANVIVDDGTPILVDFGFARFTRSTDETVVVYSRSFAAPEVIRGEAPDSSADRYAFAATALRVLTGLTASKATAPEIRAALERAGLPAKLIEHAVASLDQDPRCRPGDLSAWYEPEPIVTGPVVRAVPIPSPSVQAMPAVEDPIPAGTVMRAQSAPAVTPAPAQTPQASSRSNASTIMTVLALTLVALAAVGVGVWLWLRSGPTEVVVPDMVGSTNEDAVDMLDGIPVTASIEPVDSTADPGTVVSVSPAAGSVIESGSEIIIEYASASFTMPEVTGQPVADAVQEIISRGVAEDRIKMRPVAEEDSSIWCLVQSQAPDAKERWDRSSEVAVVVAVARGKSAESCLVSGG